MNVLFGRCSSQIHRLSHHKRARTVCTSTQYESAPISQVQHPSSVLDKNILPLWLRSQHGGIFFDFFEVERAYTVSHKLAFQPPFFIGEAYNVVDREVGKSVLGISFGLFKIIEHSSIKYVHPTVHIMPKQRMGLTGWYGGQLNKVIVARCDR